MDFEPIHNGNGVSNLCVLFADITGSTRLYESLGDWEASQKVKLCLDEMKAATRQSQGRVVETVGDEILSTFATPAQAALAAEDMMRRVERLAAGGKPLSLRIGFHFGPVLQENGKIFGDAVNTAARIASLARAGQIFASKSAIDLLPPILRRSTREIAAFSLKGKREEMDICEILWAGERGELTVQSKDALHPGGAKHRLLLRLGPQRVYALDAGSGPLSMGRGPENLVVIDSLRVSRHHAKIERRRDKFVLADASTNGTWVLFGGQGEVLIHHEELALHGRGFISLGSPYDPNDATRTLAFEED